jgi:hypothetical protein
MLIVYREAARGVTCHTRSQAVNEEVQYEMKSAVYWDITPQFVLHRRHITLPLQSPAS